MGRMILSEKACIWQDGRVIDPASGSFIRIGCSATVEPLQEVADFLAGNFRPVEVVDCRFSRHLDLRLICPVPDLILADQKELSDGLYGLFHRHIQDHKSTLIFTNSQKRSGAAALQPAGSVFLSFTMPRTPPATTAPWAGREGWRRRAVSSRGCSGWSAPPPLWSWE